MDNMEGSPCGERLGDRRQSPISLKIPEAFPFFRALSLGPLSTLTACWINRTGGFCVARLKRQTAREKSLQTTIRSFDPGEGLINAQTGEWVPVPKLPITRLTGQVEMVWRAKLARLALGLIGTLVHPKLFRGCHLEKRL